MSSVLLALTLQFGSNSLSGSHQLHICLATSSCKFAICKMERHMLLWERFSPFQGEKVDHKHNL